MFLADETAGYEVRGLLGQHGFSVLVEAIDSKGRVHRVLFDAGQYGEAVVHNAKILGIDLASIEAIALSHHHYDHTGGLREVLDAVGKKIPVIGHVELFRPSIYARGDNIRLDIGIPYRRNELESLGAKFLLLRNSLEIAPGIYWLGEIPREYPDLAPGLPGNYTINDEGELVPHSLRDDTGLAVSVEGYGLVVIGGCSHSGIVNIVNYASRLLGDTPRLVTGGFHMMSMSEEKIREAGRILQSRLGVEEIHAGHCTGLKAECILREIYREKFNKIHTGYVIEISPKR